MTTTPHHRDRLPPSTADGIICQKTGLDLPALLDSTHPLAQPLRLIRNHLVLAEQTLRHVSDRTAQSIAVRRELLDAGHLAISPAWTPAAGVLDHLLGERVGTINALSALLDCWTWEPANPPEPGPNPDPEPGPGPQQEPERELTAQETGERENALGFWLGPRTADPAP
ncbi:hypothetical protein ABT160_38200 [Streptomyces sp. NPDC001941]|uniref:hypothetical protein n=1 Tax=Streptomyces sp. NPDC001941 TaxID=3154659 RepID=UPI00332E6283